MQTTNPGHGHANPSGIPTEGDGISYRGIGVVRRDSRRHRGDLPGAHVRHVPLHETPGGRRRRADSAGDDRLRPEGRRLPGGAGSPNHGKPDAGRASRRAAKSKAGAAAAPESHGRRPARSLSVPGKGRRSLEQLRRRGQERRRLPDSDRPGEEIDLGARHSGVGSRCRRRHRRHRSRNRARTRQKEEDKRQNL